MINGSEEYLQEIIIMEGNGEGDNVSKDSCTR
jgi:hypothetical protein